MYYEISTLENAFNTKIIYNCKLHAKIVNFEYLFKQLKY